MRTSYRIGRWLVVPEHNQIADDGEQIRIEPRVMQVLLHLAEHADGVVSREQILESVWEGTHVSDEVLTNAIRELRKALGDDAKEPQFILTVPKKGYRLIAPVTAAEGPRPQTQRYALTRWAIVIALVLTAVATSLGTYLLIQPSQETVGKRLSPSGTLTQLTTDAGVEMFPSLSPDGRFVAYTSPSAGNWDIYVLRVGGSNPVNLTKDCEVTDGQPAFSPDGNLIAFRSQRDGGGLFVMGATGESVKRITDSGYNPAWSSDGKLIAFSTVGVASQSRVGGTGQLRIADIETGEILIIETDLDAVQPSWSPNGRRIAFWSVTPDGQRDIWTIPVEGGEPVPITDDEHIDWNPVWSHNGDTIYFSSDRGGTMSLWRIAVNEEEGTVQGRPELVTSSVAARAEQITLSRDDTRIAYTARISRTELQKVCFDPETEAIEGEPVSIIKGSLRTISPNASSNGEWLAFSYSEDIAVSRTDGSSLRKLTDDPHMDFGPRWSPDGSQIAFYSNRGGTFNLWVIHPDGSGLRPLTQTTKGRGIYGPTWSSDGRMAFGRFEGGTSIFDPGKPWNEQSLKVLPPYGDGTEEFTMYSWSPDGRWLSGNIRLRPGVPTGIVIYDVEAQRYEWLTDFGVNPFWLGDSKRLLFSARGAIYLVDRESGGYHEIFSAAPDRIHHSAAISPDNRWIYFSRIADEVDIWMNEIER